MSEIIKQPRWKKVEYSRKEIENAGKIIKSNQLHTEDYKKALTVIDNWRSAHAFPLHVIYMNLRRLCSQDSRIIVAERLKRLDSIIKKLERENGMNLWRMQDLGGCRVIVQRIEDVHRYATKYDTSRKRHIKKREYDYIAEPKPSGYRSLHIIYQYYSDQKDTYNNNMLIEIQFRTHLQHLWATAVETMGLFTGEAIKSGQGSDDVKRFFVLVSALFAIQENKPLPPNVENDKKIIINELSMLDGRHHYLDFLNEITVAVDRQSKTIEKSKSIGYYILILNYETKKLEIRSYKSSDIDLANDDYRNIENKREESKIDAVLVRVASFENLRKAFPNYFSDIKKFVNLVKKYLYD